MLLQDGVRNEFERYTDPIEFARRYRYYKRKNNITTDSEVFDILLSLEMINMLGTLYVISIREKEIAGVYVKDFVKRNEDLLLNRIQIDNDEIVNFMQIVYLCMMYLNNEERDELSKHIFSGNIYKRVTPECFEFENEGYVSEHYSKVFLSAVTKFPKEIEWKSKYCEIITSIYRARNNSLDFLHRIEVGLRKNAFGYDISDEAAYNYFSLLCSNQDYEAARYFLDNFDGSKGFLGIDCIEFADLLFSLPDTGLLTVGKWLIKQYKNSEYSYAEWCEDVLLKNSDENCRKWIKLTLFYHEMMEMVEQEDWEKLDGKLQQVNSYDLFPMDKIKYIKQLVEDFAYIFNNIILKRTDKAKRFLDEIAQININGFSKTRYLSQWNKKESVRDEYDYDHIIDVLFEEYDINDVIYIYMNSHLKSIINLENLIEKCADNMGEDLFELFADYPIVGRITLGSRLNSIRDKLYVSPIGIESKVSYFEFVQVCETYGPLSKQAQNFNKRMIRSHQRWYAYNKDVAELFKTGDVCTFRIKNYQRNQGVLASDFMMDEELKNQRIMERNAQYPVMIKEWLSKIQGKKAYIEWNENDPIYGVRHIIDTNCRIDIALEIINTIEALQNNESELERFIYAISNAPLEEINEFRYISTQRRFDFEFPKERFSADKYTIIQKANQILKNSSLSGALRKDIYLNTCMRKYYDLQEACKQFGKELYIDTADEPFVMALKYEKKVDEVYYFSTRGRSNTIFAQRQFMFIGQPRMKLTENYIYLVVLDKYNFTTGCFTLKEVDLSNEQTEQWKKYLRKVRDIKKATSNSEMTEVKNDLKKYMIRVKSKNHILQFTHELDLIFKRFNYAISSGISILDIISETNPFLDKEIDFACLHDEFEKDYLDSYALFLRDYREKFQSPAGFCDFYFSSYLKVFVDFQKFITDISGDKYTKDDILYICKGKGYII